MKLKFLLPVCALAVTALASCKKDKTTEDDTETTFSYESANLQGTTQFINNDVIEVVNEAAVSNSFMGSNFVAGGATVSGVASCANITVTSGSPAGFPKTVVIDFGNGCTSAFGIVRSGKINVNVTDSLRKPGSIATITFDNYYVAGYKKEGTIIWKNTSTPSTKSWNRECQNGKITSTTGNTWTHAGIEDGVQSAGFSTPMDLRDDVFTITGSHTVTNSANVTRTWVITSPLEKKTMCSNITKGVYTVTGRAHTAVIDLGNGACDHLATVAIDGGTPHTIILP